MTTSPIDATDQGGVAMNPEEFVSSPVGHIYGILDDPKSVPGFTASLLDAGVELSAMHVYCCREGAAALDATGTRHGRRERISRALQSFRYSNDHQAVIDEALMAGHVLVGVAVDDEDRDRVTRIFTEHGGHDVVHYGKLSWEYMTTPTSEHRTQPPE